MIKRKVLFALVFIITCSFSSFTQNFLSTDGRAIVNENQDTILLRGMGLGGWMVQEGYMLQTAGFASPQHKIRSTIEALIGEANTNEFYEAWLANHVRKSDIDSLKAWGFNSVRLPMHYNLFTLPIEDEPIAGEDTWINTGFELTDSLLSWCKANEMYVVLDMHAAPGGQGYDEAISDYDPTKPSLWESNENKRKLVALWTRIAEYYADEEWVAGYDLLNEPNWDLPGGNALRTIYQQIIEGIRSVDDRHIVFVEGNWFANDFTGLTPPWDDNFVYSPHKYWSTNDEATMQWVIDLRNTYNVPLYLGESGENSNVWFRDAIALLEGLDIGWAWWPMKKVESISGPLSIVKSPEYQTLLDYWSGNGTPPSASFATDALMDLANNLKTENCIFQKDVIDAMFRQVYSQETLPFKEHNIPGVIHASDYDLGVMGAAYFDVQSGNYSVSTGEFTSWNDGWQYRNDGVDLEVSQNAVNTNGYNVGFMDVGEWMQYELTVEEAGVYEAHIRSASGGSGGLFHLTMDGGDIIPRSFLGPTGGWQNWQTTVIPDIILKESDQKLRFYTDVAGFNLASIEFVKTTADPTELPNIFLAAETANENTVQVNINKSLDANLGSSINDIEIHVDGITVPVSAISVDVNNNRLLRIEVDYTMNSTEMIQVSYTGTEIVATDATPLQEFILEDVRNTLNFIHQIPGRIEAEDYDDQFGVELESTTDVGGGLNIGFLDPNDWLEYEVIIKEEGSYRIDYRTAAQFGMGILELRLIDVNGIETIVDIPTFESTGDWQSWETTSSFVDLPKGLYTLRIRIVQGPFNINWLDFDKISSVNEFTDVNKQLHIFPNPSSDYITVKIANEIYNARMTMLDLNGRLISQTSYDHLNLGNMRLDVNHLSEGIYILRVELANGLIYNGRFTKL